MTRTKDLQVTFTEDFTVIGQRGVPYRFLHDLVFSIEIAVTQAGTATLVLGLKRAEEEPCYLVFDRLDAIENLYTDASVVFATVNKGGGDERAD